MRSPTVTADTPTHFPQAAALVYCLSRDTPAGHTSSRSHLKYPTCHNARNSATDRWAAQARVMPMLSSVRRVLPLPAHTYTHTHTRTHTHTHTHRPASLTESQASPLETRMTIELLLTRSWPTPGPLSA